MTNLVKRTLLVLIFINFLILLFLLNIRNKFFIKNPELGTNFNKIIENNEFCKQFNSGINNIFEFAGKSLIFNIYNIDDEGYTKNLDLINKAIEEKLNVNIIDIILFKNRDENKVVNFILKYKIDRPVFYIEKSFFNKKFSVNPNSILISDLNINDFVELDKFEYNFFENVVENFYKKTKKIRSDLITKSTKLNNDELLIKSIKSMLIVNNKDDDVEIFFVDEISKNIFSTYTDGNLGYYIGNGKNDEGLLQDAYFKNIKSIKYYNNDLYVLDDIYIKKLDLKNDIVTIVLENDLIKNCVDFDITDKGEFILSDKFGKIILNINGKYKISKFNFISAVKFKRYNNELYLFDSNNLKIYQFKDNKFNNFLDLANLVNNDIDVIDFAIKNKILYLIDVNGNLYIVKDDSLQQIKIIDNVNGVQSINTDNNNLYLSDGSNLYKINLLDINNKNKHIQLNKIDFKFSYKSQNHFSKKEFDFSQINNEILLKDKKLTILINSDLVDKYITPNYIDLYEINDGKIVYLKEANILDKNIIFDDIDDNKNYYLNGKIYYKHNDEIFVKKINSFVSFKDNHFNRNIEINFNNIYIN